MASDVEAVIAALREVLRDAEHRTWQDWWPTRTVNRWIAMLPGARYGRWRHLKLRKGLGDNVSRLDLAAHVRATIAYLETNRAAVAAVPRWPWPAHKKPVEPIEPRVVGVADVALTKPKQSPTPSKKPRVIN